MGCEHLVAFARFKVKEENRDEAIL